MNQAFRAHFRCPDTAADFRLGGSLSARNLDFFGLAKASIVMAKRVYNLQRRTIAYTSTMFLAPSSVEGHQIVLPFDPDQVADNLRCEAYTGQMRAEHTHFGGNAVIRAIYYLGRPAFPVHFRRILQRIRLQGGTHTPFPHWPVDRSVDRLFEELMKLAVKSRNNTPVPFIWFWPEGAPAAAVVTHDVETELGRDFCSQLMDMDDDFGFKSSFQIVPERRYEVTGTIH